MRLVPASLRLRLLFLVLAALLPAFALLGWDARQERAERLGEVRQETRRLAELAARDEELLIAETRQLLALLSQLPPVREGSAGSCHDLLRGLLEAHGQYANLGVIELDGDVSCSGLPLHEPVNLADRPYFRRALAAGEFAAGDYQIGRITGQASINFGYPVLDSTDRPRSVVFAALSLEWLNDLAGWRNNPTGSRLTVVDRAGTILTDSVEPKRWVGEAYPDSSLVELLIRNGVGFAEGEGLDGSRQIFAYQPLQRAGERGRVFLLVGIPRDAAVGPVERALQWRLGLLGAVAALTLGGTWVLSEVMLVRPVRTLVSAARRLSGGELGARTGESVRQGELGELAAAFNEMADSLERSLEAQRRLNEDLERQVEERTAELERTVLRSERSETIAELGRRFAHEILNPLGALLNATFLMRSGVEEGDTQTLKRIRGVEREAMRIDRLVRDLLTYAEPPRPQWADVDLGTVLREAVDESRIPAGIEVVFEVESVPAVAADPSYLRQAIGNLVANAVEAMPGGGVLTLRLRAEANAAIVEVSDTGTGIPEEHRPKIFDALFTTKTAGGFGLGLAAVRSIVAAHRGSVDVETAEGRGSAFRITLPLRAGSERATE